MKITLEKKAAKSLAAGITRVELVDRSDTRFVERGKETTIELGVSNLKNLTRRKMIRTMRKVIRQALAHRIEKIAFDAEMFAVGENKKIAEAELVELLGTQLLMANYDFRVSQKAPKKGWAQVKEVIVCGIDSKDAKAALKRGMVIGEEVNLARDLANTSANQVTPKELSLRAKASVKGVKNTKVTIFGEKELKKHKMEALLSVGQGSAAESHFVIMEYNGGKKGEKPFALVGKGITYDTGGLHLKPGGAIEDMHLDMAGGAAMIHAFAAIARLGIKKNVVAVIACAENMISGESYRPGDVIGSKAGKTIEILNTDAEGRVALCDAVTYVQEHFDPKAMVDAATLTGGSLVALGTHASAIMCLENKGSLKLRERIEELSEEVGEYVWPLPLWKEYRQYVSETKRADISNIPVTNPRLGHSTNGGAFIAEFVDKDRPWVHIDMAPRMVSCPTDNLAAGATGEPLQLMVRLVEEY